MALSTGQFTALIAVGIVIVFRITGVLNVAFGATGLIAVYTFADLTGVMNPWLAFLVVLLGSILVGGLIGIATLGVQNASQLSKVVASLGLVSVLTGLVGIIWPGSISESPPSLVTGTAFWLLGFPVTWQRVIAVVAAAGISATAILFFRKGLLGSALRAMADSVTIARLVGLPVRLLWTLAWVVATVLAVFVAVLVFPDVGFDVTSQTFIVFVPLAAAMVARFRSVEIASVAALGLGIGEGLMQGSPALANYVDLLPLIIIVAALLVFPQNSRFERV